MGPTDRRIALLDATLELIGEGGLGTVTHRRVEARVGLPHGSTTYYFKSKQALLDAAIEHLLAIDLARSDAIGHAVAAALAPREPLDQLDWSAIARAIVDWIEQDRTLQLARYELQIATARERPATRDAAAAREGAGDAPMVAAAETFLERLEPLVIAAGSSAPRRDAQILLATINGLMFEQLSRPSEQFATEVLPAALRKLLASFATP